MKKKTVKGNKTALPASLLLESLVREHKGSTISFLEIRNKLHEQGFCLLMVVFAFPAALPLPYPPGFTTIVGVPLAVFAFQMMLGLPSPWLPDWLGKRAIPHSLLVSITKKAVPLLKRMEYCIKPRFSFVDTVFGEKLVGVFCCIAAVLISVPVPFGHMLPGLAVLLMALGFLDRDGIVVIAGMVLAVLGLGVDIFIMVIGTEAVLKVFSIVGHHNGF